MQIAAQKMFSVHHIEQQSKQSALRLPVGTACAAWAGCRVTQHKRVSVQTVVATSCLLCLRANHTQRCNWSAPQDITTIQIPHVQ